MQSLSTEKHNGDVLPENRTIYSQTSSVEAATTCDHRGQPISILDFEMDMTMTW